MPITGCYTDEEKTIGQNTKHLLFKDSASDPFTAFSIDNRIAVSDGSSSGLFYVIGDSYEYTAGTTWALPIGSVTRASKQVSEANLDRSDGVTCGAVPDTTDWNNNAAYTSENVYASAGSFNPVCGGVFADTDIPLIEWNTSFDGLYLDLDGGVDRLPNGWQLGTGQKYISGAVTAAYEGGYFEWGTTTGYYGDGEELWDVWGTDTTGISLAKSGGFPYSLVINNQSGAI